MEDIPATVPTVPKSTIVPSHKIASWLLRTIDRFMDWLGLDNSHTIEEILYVVAIAIVAIGLGLGIKYLLLWLLRKAVHLRKSAGAKELLHEHTLAKCSHIIPPLVFMALIPFAFNHSSHVLWWILRIVGVYLLIAFGVAACAVLTFIFNRYNARENTRNLPLNGVLNIGKGIVWIVIFILCVSVLIDKSPAGILAGLGAFAAALMLIFKDSILGFVAGIQMAQNDMLHVGDWIVVPGTPANGTVLDMSLTAVKVQNWDNTITTVPPYTLVSGAFTNWRGMSESGVRRIMRNFTIDYAGIGPVTDQLLQTVTKKYPAVQPYVETMQKAEPGNGGWMVNGGLRLPNGTLETNLGLFRAYLCAYLSQNPHISSTHRILVQLLDPTIYGYPLQIWCWSATTEWNAYESIQSAIMEHVAKVVGDFGLSIYSAGSETIDISDPQTPVRPRPVTSGPSSATITTTASSK